MRNESNVPITPFNSSTTNTHVLIDCQMHKAGTIEAKSSLVELAISCPTSNLSSPSRSRTASSSSSRSHSSTASLPPSLSTVPTKTQETCTPKIPVSPVSVLNELMRSVELGSHRINALSRRLITVDPEDNLLKALRLLSRLRLHHLPVIDCPQQRTGNILYVLTQRVMLSYLYSKLVHLPQPRFLQVRHYFYLIHYTYI